MNTTRYYDTMASSAVMDQTSFEINEIHLKGNILRWYKLLRGITITIVLFIVIGIVGSLWISVDYPAVLGASFLCGTIMIVGGLLLGVWSDQTYATIRSWSIIRTIVDFLVLLFIGIYMALQLNVIIALCPAPPDPVSAFNCSTGYAIMIASVVYAGILILLILFVIIVEIGLARRVKEFGEWELQFRVIVNNNNNMAPNKNTIKNTHFNYGMKKTKGNANEADLSTFKSGGGGGGGMGGSNFRTNHAIYSTHNM